MFYRLDFDFASDTVMEYQRIVAPGEGHRNRAQNVQPEIAGVLDKCNNLKNTIVRLRFNFGVSTRYGTGFFVNLPSPTHDVILTAAHNLIDEKKILATNMTVIYGDNDEESATEFRICPTYIKYLETDPKSDDRGIYDYGVILLAKCPSSEPERQRMMQNMRQGMGLSLGIYYNDTLRDSKDVRVSGYDEKGGDSPIQSSGPLVRVGDQLEYLAPTEPGMSGSAVWVPYGGQPMVVGIQ
ncbi:hypothetical protein A9Z42_0069830 [Trichoderma parareesei]|uniref:Serine protease n=1 Tax=Trichoderma parareesei TaxID=858221 RepID=A0A2H3A4R2_TRIPA|nr:hypothetical protein A9Z42_0069830 [Trichoderma parareesei]